MCYTDPKRSLLLILSLVSLCYAATPPAFETEIWEKAPLLVWAHPGQSGDFSDAGQWQQPDGSPATHAPDRNTDILLPAASSWYKVSGSRTDQVRHVTIEKNAMLHGGHRNEVEIWGNCHVKAGGFVKYISIRGDKHTFFKIDGSKFPSEENGTVFHHPGRRVGREQLCRAHISHKFQVCKFGTASVEFFGKLGVSDEVMVQHGKMIVSGEFRYSGVTGKGALEVYDGGILELQSGGRVAPFIGSNRKCVYNVNVYRNGTLQAGSPERPLTHDAYLMLGFIENDQPGRSGLYTAMGSMMRVYTRDPEKARLVISATVADPGFRDAQGNPPETPDLDKAKGKIGIAMQLAGDVQLHGVHFDYVSEAGIGIADGKQPSHWRDVTWGRHCADARTKLFSELAVNPNVYYHPRSDQRSEYGLTVRAVAEMAEYLKASDPFQIHTLPPSKQTPDKGGDVRPVLQIKTGTKTRSIRPVDDMTVDNGRPVGDGLLRVRPAKRVAFLKFHVSGLRSAAENVTLQLTENGDVGHGTVRVYRGEHDDWTEQDITVSDVPAKGREMGRFSGAIEEGQKISIDLSEQSLGNGPLTLVLEMDPGGNDAAFGSRENKQNVVMGTLPAVVYREPIAVTIETQVPGAKIRYTLDGSEPSKASPVYTGPIRLDKTTKITAKAFKPGVGFSSVFTTTYVFE